MTTKTPVEQYAELTAQIKALEDQKTALNATIVMEMNSEGTTNQDTAFGTFLVAWRKSWKYSTDTEMLEVELKEAQKREQNNGKAVIDKQSQYLRYLPLKEAKV